MALSRRQFGGALLGASLAGWFVRSGAKAHDGPHTHRVVIEKFAFVPARLTVRPGDTIEWINADLAPHTATARDRTWDTGSLGKGANAGIVATIPGRLDYFCRFHPHMAGEIIVSTTTDMPTSRGDHKS